MVKVWMCARLAPFRDEGRRHGVDDGSALPPACRLHAPSDPDNGRCSGSGSPTRGMRTLSEKLPGVPG